MYYILYIVNINKRFLIIIYYPLLYMNLIKVIYLYMFVILILAYLTILFIHSSIPKFGDENVLMYYYVLYNIH